MAQPCGPYCSHPQCWSSSKLEEHSVDQFADGKQHVFEATPCPTLTVFSLNEALDTSRQSAVPQENRLPNFIVKHMRRSVPNRAPNLSRNSSTNGMSFAEMQIFGDGDINSYDNQIYQWVARPGQSSKASLSAMERDTLPVIHTVNILQQALPNGKKSRSGMAPQRTSIKARSYMRQHREKSNTEFGEGADELEQALLNLIASSRNSLPPTDTPLPAEQAYRKYAATMLPKSPRSESVRTPHRHETDSVAASIPSSGISRFASRNRSSGIPLTTLTLRLESSTGTAIQAGTKFSAVAERHVVMPSKFHRSPIHEGKAAPKVDQATVRIFSGYSLRARQGSLKPSTASSSSRRLLTSPELDEGPDDPLGYLLARQNLQDNVSHLSDRGTDASLRCKSTADSIITEATKITARSENVGQPAVPIIEDILELARGLASPDSAAQTGGRVPPATPAAPPILLAVETGNISPRQQLLSPRSPQSPPWPGQFMYESAGGSPTDTRAPSVTRAGSPISGMNSALDWQGKDTTIISSARSFDK